MSQLIKKWGDNAAGCTYPHVIGITNFLLNAKLYFPFLNSLGFMPFILLKKRAKVVTSAKWS